MRREGKGETERNDMRSEGREVRGERKKWEESEKRGRQRVEGRDSERREAKGETEEGDTG